MQRHLLNFGTRQTPQSQPIPGRTDMSENNAGGYAWKVDDWELLNRFLILGTEGGTYYVGQRILTQNACQATMRCIKEDGVRVVDTIVDVSDKGRAAKNDYALFALAMCAGVGADWTRKAAFDALPKVARIGTHLFNFVSYMEQFRGWGRGARQAVAKWYNDKDPEQLAYQLVKYKQRDGWSHRDLLRLAHPVPITQGHEALYAWVVGKAKPKYWEMMSDIIRANEMVLASSNVQEIANIIKISNLPRECVPTEYLSKREIWEALLENMPMTAMIRNLGNLGKVGLLVPGTFDVIDKVTSQLTSMDALRKARIHPLSILVAMNTYSSGHSYRGSGEWPVVGDVVDALDSAFYKAFDVVEPTGKRICIGLDVSGSMGSGEINGIPGMTPRVGACAMSMVTYKVEPRVSVMAFCDTFVPIDMSRHRRLDDLVTYTNSLPFGGTDCSLPITWALNMWRQRPTVIYDAFIIYTDNETWAGDMHPKQALDIYRQQVNPEAKLVVVGMTATDISIADPTDPGMLDVVGFDTAAPNIISQFIK